EQVNNILYQIDLSQNNKERIVKLLENGRSNVLELSQSQTQLATDSSLYWQAVLNYKQSILELQTILNVDYNQAFTVGLSDLQGFVNLPGLMLEKPNPEAIYTIALNNYHSIKASEIGIQMAAKDLQITKANSLPQFSLFYSTGTNYSSSFYEY